MPCLPTTNIEKTYLAPSNNRANFAKTRGMTSDTTSTNRERALEISSRGKSNSLPAIREQVPLHAHNARSLANCCQIEAQQLVPYSLCKKLNVLPLSIQKLGSGVCFLSVMSSSPVPADGLKELQFVSGMIVEVDLVTDMSLSEAIEHSYLGNHQNLSLVLSEHESVGNRASELFDAILSRAIALDASDVHLEPMADERYQLRLRVNGRLSSFSLPTINRMTAEQLIRITKVRCRLPGQAVGRPFEGGFSFSYASQAFRIRASVVHNITGDKAVWRILESQKPETRRTPQTGQHLSELGLESEQIRILVLALALPQGTILVTGPTGSGKSTLMYAMLNVLRNESKNIVSLEDPVERMISGVQQIEVSDVKGLGFEKMLSAVLRQDPDIIAVGEIRSEESAKTALTAGITGHLVMATIHSGSCVEALSRLLDMKLSLSLISSSLRLVISQRLIPINCRHCLSYSPAPNLLIKALDLPNSVETFSSRGCTICQQTGIGGRTGVYELLPITPKVRDVLQKFNFNRRGFSDSNSDGLSAHIISPFQFSIRRLLLRGSLSPNAALVSLGLPVNADVE